MRAPRHGSVDRNRNRSRELPRSELLPNAARRLNPSRRLAARKLSRSSRLELPLDDTAGTEERWHLALKVGAIDRGLEQLGDRAPVRQRDVSKELALHVGHPERDVLELRLDDEDHAPPTGAARLLPLQPNVRLAA